MKRLLFTILLFTAALPAAAQLYHPGEQLFYRVSYKAKMFPNTEVGAVEVKTSEVQLDDRKFYKVEGIAAHLPLVLQPRRHLHGMDQPRDAAPGTFRK